MTIGGKYSIRQKEIIKAARGKLADAVRIMRMQNLTRRDRPAHLKAFWVAYGNAGMADAQYRRPARPKASPEQLREMGIWLDRVLALEAAQRRIVMARAAGIPWRRLEEMDGRSHTTLRKIEAAALLQMAMRDTPPVRKSARVILQER